ncbi:MAG: CBS domain-containing protein [Phycisphaeraceae bacterium]|nr:MAG: CBS domain-containing protein [Phycisphaeraceae bacterium]
MLIRDVMTKHVISVSMDSTLHDVRQVFEAASFHHLIVTEHGKVVGVMSDRDLLKHISPFVGKMAERRQDVASLDRKVHQVMSRGVRTIGPDETVAEAGRRMMRDKIGCLPVVDEDRHPIGIITIRDVAKMAIEMLGDFLQDVDEAA